MEGPIHSAGASARRPPDPDLDLDEHLLELALRLAVGPAVGLRSERDDLTPAIHADTQAVGRQPVLPVVHPDLALGPLLQRVASLRLIAAPAALQNEAEPLWSCTRATSSGIGVVRTPGRTARSTRFDRDRPCQGA